MLAPIRPDTLLVKFLFAAPCLLAMLTVTCHLESGPAAGTDRPADLPPATTPPSDA